MKKFIEKNWFKLSIVILLGIGILSYTLSSYTSYLKQQIQAQTDKNDQIMLDKNKETSALNEDFEKKAACQKYEKQIKDKLKESDTYIEQSNITVSNMLDTIFYSKKTNSCLYQYQEWNTKGYEPQFISHSLVDVLTGELLETTMVWLFDPDNIKSKDDLINERVERERAFMVKVEEYK